MRMWFELRHIFQGPKFLIKNCLKTNFKTARGKFLWITKNLPLWAAPVKQNIQKSIDVKFVRPAKIPSQDLQLLQEKTDSKVKSICLKDKNNKVLLIGNVNLQ